MMLGPRAMRWPQGPVVSCAMDSPTGGQKVEKMLGLGSASLSRIPVPAGGHPCFALGQKSHSGSSVLQHQSPSPSCSPIAEPAP